MKNILTTFFLTFCFSSFGQVSETIYQTFTLDDEVQEVTLDIYDEFIVEEQIGNTIMVVTEIKFHSGAQHVLKFYIHDLERYNVESSGKESTLKLTSKNKKRDELEYRGLKIFEEVTMKINIPDSFKLVGKNKLVRKDEETASTDQ